MIASSLALVACPAEVGWKVTTQAETPTIFAITSPASTNLNVRAVVLACENVFEGGKSLQLQIYPTNLEPILPRGASRDSVKESPTVELTIDGKVFPVLVAFGGDYALLLDREDGTKPVLTAPLLDALEAGRSMVVRFDLVREAAGQPAAFDGELRVDLKAGEAAAIATVRRACP